MRICELCGSEQEMEIEDTESERTRILHVCENCQNDRSVNYFDI
ncbi:ribosome-binding protein aMBF1 (putative translation factor) [Peribacillus deserti]|uniref:Ribosome-binding protein aMBF1 (Putative translation factor) n=1 Tax=Peribacillus deserti TaxID=673318 RepID=A0ABS2QGD1_9BACI|nr:hypothetical protein [Peribacillus deserti]MBM7692085.1 ribosome-binding protein aMBF1 (putative translation factor) [Peribacillus deserti]